MRISDWSSDVCSSDLDDRLSSQEVIATCALLLFGGHETTTNLIASGALALLQHPQALDDLARDGELMGTALEEILRYDGPAKLAVRVASERIELRGAVIEPGQRVFLCTSSANRDENRFADPDSLMLDRADNQHLGFGFGLHYCPGASLARLEGSLALERLLPELRSEERRHVEE